jgi:nucleoside-diphosphate kinase
VGEIISRFEKKGFKLIGLKLFQCSKELAEVCSFFNTCFYVYHVLCSIVCSCFVLGYGVQVRLFIYTCKAYYDCLWFQEHYKDLKQKSFLPARIEYITSGPVVSMV